MSLKVVELNDVSLQVGDAGGILAASPGFALLEGKELTLGEAAEQQHRIYPTSSYDKFWHELNMEPLHIRSHIRHHADLAYSQLFELAKLAEIDGDAVLAAPGHYSSAQLGLLLGVAGQCPFRVAGVVDSALAAASGEIDAECIVHVGLYLHQALLTRVLAKDGNFTVDTVVEVPQLGRQQLLDVLMDRANDAFIRQCRFNPQHEAGSEQDLYTALAQWTGGASQGHLEMELTAGAVTHAAKLARDDLLAGLKPSYEKLLRSLRPLLEAPGAIVLLDHRLAPLPGAVSALGEAGQLQVARPEAVIAACLRHQGQITSGDGVHRVRALTGADSVSSGPEQTPAAAGMPTHVLFRHRAMPITDLAEGLVLDIPGPGGRLGRIHRRRSEVMFDCGEIEFRLNDVPVKGLQALKLGDRIRFRENSEELLMIEVSDGRQA